MYSISQSQNVKSGKNGGSASPALDFIVGGVAMIDDILSIYNLSTSRDRSEGRFWYQAARLECLALAEEYNLDPRRVVWAVAALSPQLKWELNIRAARAIIQGATSYRGVYNSNIEKAWHILWDADDWEKWLDGPKVTCFAKNIWGDPCTVTVDTWTWRVWAGLGLWARPKKIDHQAVTADYVQAACQVGLEPRQLQAITWVTIRRLANGRAALGQLSLDI
jgi:hypothetical protein